MRVGHLILSVFLSAIVMSLARTPEGRVMVVDGGGSLRRAATGTAMSARAWGRR